MAERKLAWFRIPGIGQKGSTFLTAGGICQILVEGKQYCLLRVQDELYAVDSKCPHNGAALSKGKLSDEGILSCPLHRYDFDVKNGKNISGEGFYLEHYPIEVRENGTFIGLPKKKFWDLF